MSQTLIQSQYYFCKLLSSFFKLNILRHETFINKYEIENFKLYIIRKCVKLMKQGYNQ